MERASQFRKRISTSNQLHKVIMTSVTDEGRIEAHTQRERGRELRDGGGQCRVLSLVKQWLIARVG